MSMAMSYANRDEFPPGVENRTARLQVRNNPQPPRNLPSAVKRSPPGSY